MKNAERSLRSVAISRSHRDEQVAASSATAILILAEFVGNVEKLNTAAILASMVGDASHAEEAFRSVNTVDSVSADQRSVRIEAPRWYPWPSCLDGWMQPGQIHDAVRNGTGRWHWMRPYAYVVASVLMLLSILVVFYYLDQGHVFRDEPLLHGNVLPPNEPTGVPVGPGRRLFSIPEKVGSPQRLLAAPEVEDHGLTPWYLLAEVFMLAVICGLLAYCTRSRRRQTARCRTNP
jgi:hypothetical protein